MKDMWYLLTLNKLFVFFFGPSTSSLPQELCLCHFLLLWFGLIPRFLIVRALCRTRRDWIARYFLNYFSVFRICADILGMFDIFQHIMWVVDFCRQFATCDITGRTGYRFAERTLSLDEGGPIHTTFEFVCIALCYLNL